MRRMFGVARRNKKGFTLIELLVVIALLGVLAAVAIPNVGKFIGKGKTESYATELHNIQTGVMALMAESKSGLLDAAITTATGDLSTVLATKTTAGDINLAQYVNGINADGTVKTGCTYTFTIDGKATQIPPA